jgi:hypothetical protein
MMATPSSDAHAPAPTWLHANMIAFIETGDAFPSG